MCSIKDFFRSMNVAIIGELSIFGVPETLRPLLEFEIKFKYLVSYYKITIEAIYYSIEAFLFQLKHAGRLNICSN